MRAQGTQVYQQQGIGLEQRLSELQAQIDQLNLSLHLWRQKEEQLQPAERRLMQLTDRCAEILDQWSTAGERHAQALVHIESRLSGLSALETRVQHDAAERIHDLERAIEHEWVALRQIHEEPVRQLREQAATLAEVCVAAAATAQRSFERAEARLASLEADLHRRLSELSRDVHAAGGGAAGGKASRVLAENTAAWPLEGVMRLHQQVRESPRSDDAETVVPSEDSPAPPAVPAVEPSGGLSERLSTLEQAISEGQAEMRAAAERGARARVGWQAAGAALVAAAGIAGVMAWRSQQNAAAVAADRTAAAEQQVERVRDRATQDVAAARDDAARQIAAARDAATRAQTISDVVAAPDVIRFNLSGGTAESRYAGQLLWSRTRGFVFSASHLPAPPAGSIYQIWLATTGAPVSAGTFTPDASGRATVATDTPPRVPRPVIDVLVTPEKMPGAATPTASPVLARAVPRPAAQ